MTINFLPPSGFQPVALDTKDVPVPRIGECVLVMQTPIYHFSKSRIPRQQRLEVYQVDYDLSEICVDVFLKD